MEGPPAGEASWLETTGPFTRSNRVLPGWRSGTIRTSSSCWSAIAEAITYQDRMTRLSSIAGWAACWLAPLGVNGVAAQDAWLNRYDLSGEAGAELTLPAELGEISGLVIDARGRIFAHQDETSAVYEIDPVARRVVKRFHAGRVGLRADFEGIALVDDRFFLSTSNGAILEFREAPHGERATARLISSGLDERCELEGLAYDARSESLLLPCKEPRQRRLRDRLTVFSLPLARLESDPELLLSILWEALEVVGLDDGFHPSSIEVHPVSGSYFLASAQEEAIVEIGRDGTVLAGKSLSNERHPQPEGLAFGPDLTLWIGDEGNRRGSLNSYPLSR